MTGLARKSSGPAAAPSALPLSTAPLPSTAPDYLGPLALEEMFLVDDGDELPDWREAMTLSHERLRRQRSSTATVAFDLEDVPAAPAAPAVLAVPAVPAVPAQPIRLTPQALKKRSREDLQECLADFRELIRLQLKKTKEDDEEEKKKKLNQLIF